MAKQQRQGRCPDCGAVILVNVRRGRPAEIPLHGCRVRTCESEGCRVRAMVEEMVQQDSGEWHCPGHGLLAAARDLVSLYRAADWTAIPKMISAVLPGLIAKAEALEQWRRHGRVG